MKYPPPLKVICVLSIITLGFGFLTSCSSSSASGAAGLDMASMEDMPGEVRSAPSVVQQAYQFAFANLDVLQQIPCYCGCGEIGHTSNYDCYISNVGSDGKITLTEQTIENLRCLTRDLSPVYLEDLGLVPALEMLAQETGQKMGIEVEFHQQGNEIRLDASIELAFYRMAQEAMSNIIRHAQAKRVSLSISFESGIVRLRVTDDGTGFMLLKNTAEYAAAGHYGLLGLYERAELIGANLDIRTSPGKGTELTVSIPVHPHNSRE
jgi:signal transduction histidine kinase